MFKYLILSSLIFILGICGVFLNNRKNIVNLLICLEIIILAANINFVAFSYHIGNIEGQIFAIFNLAIAGIEVAIGLAIVVAHFKNTSSANLRDFD